MCGIVGIAGGLDHRPRLLDRMMAAIHHRGPDGEGRVVEDGIALGHKRLAIIDIDGGRQPMESADGRYVIIFNGEIYNFHDLRHRLEQRGQGFQTRSDTEVLLHWVVTFGVDGLAELNGMFAFALWDRVDRSLLLARDRLGIKPLYLLNRPDGTLSFASEIKALLPVLGQVVPDWAAIYEFLSFQNIFSERTFFSGVERLLPGEWLRWSPGNQRRGRYWTMEFRRDFTGGFDDLCERYDSVLTGSIDRHMIADVPVGAYLSGGFDSATVATLAAARSGKLATFTGAFTDSSDYDERIGSRAVADRIGADRHEIEITPRDYVDNIGKVAWFLDEPTLGSGALPQYMVAGLASQHVKVILTGHGGDEMYAGYQVNKVALIKETLATRPWMLPQVLAGVRRDEWPRTLYFLLFPLVFPEVGAGMFIMTPRRQRASMFSGDFLHRVRDHEPSDVLRGVLGRKGETPGERLMRLYLSVYLPTLLNQEDRMSMAHSIESRTPLCDNQLLDLALAAPLSLKLHGGVLKSVTKTVMRDRLPGILYGLPKRGFPTPYSRWYRHEPVRSQLSSLLFDQRGRERGIWNTQQAQKLFDANLKSTSDGLYGYARANKLWSLGIVELWFRTFVDTAQPAPVT
jgi:asparagine synthase (glutamine-hydrolysing)